MSDGDEAQADAGLDIPLTCQDAIALLADYLEVALSEEILRDLEAHLRDCAPCQAYLNTYRRTRHLAARVNRVEMPEEMKERLRAFLLAYLRGSGRSGAGL